MRHLFRNLLIPAAVVTVIVVGAYVLTFAPGAHWKLSHDAEQRARFGEYVGGTLGGTYGFLAVVGVLLTIRAQNAEAKIAELQRLMSTLSASIDALFNCEPRVVDAATRQRMATHNKAVTTITILADLFELVIDPPKNEALQAIRRLPIDSNTNSIQNEVTLICLELQQLVRLLELYSALGGDEAIEEYYRLRYQGQVAWLQAVGLMRMESVRDYFKAVAGVESLRQQRATAQ